jgi:hypothetical protein
MSTTRHYRLNRLIANLEAQFDGDAQRLRAAELEAQRAERTAQGIAAVEPSELAALFAECPWQAWAALASLTERQLLIEAIDYASWLDAQGIDKAWGAILRCWQRKLADRAAEAEALLALAEAGAFDRAGAAYEDEGREPEPETEPETPAGVPTITVESSKGDGTTYQVAIDGSSCTCKGFFWRGTCRHATEQAEAYDEAVAADAAMRRWARYGGRSAA